MKALIYPAMALALLTSCTSTPQLTRSGLDPKAFESVYRGDSTALYVLDNGSGMEVCVTNFGGRIVSITVPDRDGVSRDVVLGFDSVQAYFPENNTQDFGAAIGRYANRIAGGRFVLDGDTVRLPQNNFGHCLHGGTDMGTRGWQYRVYKAVQPDDSTLVLTLDDADGNNGFPGNVHATVTYTLMPGGTLDIDYSAVTDRPTVINMTNHSYFNLSGDPAAGILDHMLTINAANFTPIDSTFMTTGEIAPVAGTPFDFSTAKSIGRDIAADNGQLRYAMGYDHNWVLDTDDPDSVPAALLYSPATGIELAVYTDEPGIQVYTGNFLDGSVTGKQGIAYGKRAAVCLETQKYPDSPNKPEWPSAVVRPGEKYHSKCRFSFSVR